MHDSNFRVMLIILASIFVQYALSLDENGAKELACIDGPSSEEVGLDLDWFGSIERFYLPLWSRLYAYRIASSMLEKRPERISNLELTPSSCLVWDTNQVVTAYGHRKKYNITGGPDGIDFKAPWREAKSGRFQFHMTDNRSFLLGVTCWEDGQSSWAVLTKRPYLEPEPRYRVLKYVQSLGFDVLNAIEEDYTNNCYWSPVQSTHNDNNDNDYYIVNLNPGYYNRRRPVWDNYFPYRSYYW